VSTPDDLPDPSAALRAIDAAGFVVSLELRASDVTTRADVVLPVAPVVEKAGTFLDWEGRERPFVEVLRGTNAMPDVRVLHVLAAAMDVDLALPDVATARAEFAELGLGRRPGRFSDATSPTPRRRRCGRGSAGHLAAAARRGPAAGRRSPSSRGRLGAAHARSPPAPRPRSVSADGDLLTVSTDRGSVSVPVVVGELPDGVVWLPTNSAGCAVRSQLAAGTGSIVRLTAAEGGAE
jgi:NADH-quinone oxidoreductase subunit G